MSTVDFTRDGALGVVTLDSPPLNLIGDALIGDLVAAVGRVEAIDGLRALLLRGQAKVFSAGADVSLFAGKGAAGMRPLERGWSRGTGLIHRATRGPVRRAMRRLLEEVAEAIAFVLNRRRYIRVFQSART